MRPSLCPTASMPPALVVLAALVVLLASPSPCFAKRFDCQEFCRTTGFNGMVGGCRCSFTLFTAKRSPRDHNSVPGEEQVSYEASQLGGGRYFALGDLLQMPLEARRSLPANEDASSSFASSSSKGRLEALAKLGRPSSQVPLKRREFEQDLNNGDITDYLRLPY